MLAAAPLTEAFTALTFKFGAQHPGARVTFKFGASSALATQLVQGAPGDAFASDDAANLQQVVDAGSAKGTPKVFAKNRLEIAVAKGNPKHIAELADLAPADLKVVLCSRDVPCGMYADQALEQAGVSVEPTSREPSTKDALGKVEAGQVDAAIVYATDVKASRLADGVEIPDADNVISTWPIVALKDSGYPLLDQLWIDFVMSDEAQQFLQQRYGFLAP